PQKGENLQQAISREQLATRSSVGMLDASTLGKIDIQGRDAREFLGRVYTNAWAELQAGHCRYGLMCGEDGMVMDDGVTACLSENHFLMSTTTGGAAHVLSWLELYHQTEWPELDVFFNSVTDHWATIAIAGPDARRLLEPLVDIDISSDSFRFMQWRDATVAGIPARVFRISFTGELSFEINVPAHYGLFLWQTLYEAGKPFNLTPYGTETMHVLRAEKGFIITGQDTDGSMTPYDINHGWAVANRKPFSFIGKRGMNRSDCLRKDRKQLVGLRTMDPKAELPEGAQAVFNPNEAIPMSMVGHVTSSYYSANLQRRIAMAVIKGGLQRMGETVYFPLSDGQVIEAEICSSVFYDEKSLRQKS
ncbi:MAG: aminomethyltransferase family protein, partial [Granulosicoccus sp.]